MSTKLTKAEQYAAANEQAARIVAADPAKYPGVMQEWAAAVLAKSAAPAADVEPGPLFAGRLKWAPEIDHDAPAARVRD